jgi:small acid-soluble spore protein N (minor)
LKNIELFQKLALMNFSFFNNDKVRRRLKMGNPKKDSKHFRPSHLGTQPRAAGGNNGKQMQDKSGKHPQVIQTKGE